MLIHSFTIYSLPLDFFEACSNQASDQEIFSKMGPTLVKLLLGEERDENLQFSKKFLINSAIIVI